MIVAVDVDDTCGSLVGELLRRYNRDYDDNVQFDQITDWDIRKFVKPEAKQYINLYFEDPSMYDNITPDPNALTVINYLRNYNIRIVYVTYSTFGSAGRKYFWLKEHGFLQDPKDYIEAKDKSLIRCDFLVDDNYTNVTTCQGMGILLNKPWNMNYQYPFRANTWFNVSKLIKNRYVKFMERISE